MTKDIEKIHFFPIYRSGEEMVIADALRNFAEVNEDAVLKIHKIRFATKRN